MMLQHKQEMQSVMAAFDQEQGEGPCAPDIPNSVPPLSREERLREETRASLSLLHDMMHGSEGDVKLRPDEYGLNRKLVYVVNEDSF